MKKQNFWKKLTLSAFSYKPRLLKVIYRLITIGLFLTSAPRVFAGSLPVIRVLESVSDDISGPIAASVCTIMLVVTGLMNAFGEWGDGMKKLINVTFWASLVFGAAAVISIFRGS